MGGQLGRIEQKGVRRIRSSMLLWRAEDFEKPQLASIKGRHPVVDRSYRRGEVVRRRAKVDGKPIPGSNGAVFRAGISGRQEIFNVRADNVGEGYENHFFGKMYEAVAAKQQVGLWKHVLTEIEGTKLSFGTAIMDLRIFDQSRNDVGTDVVIYRKAHLGHPMKVAARQIKKGSNLKFTDKRGKGFSQISGVMEGRPDARNRFLIAPDVASIDLREHLARPTGQIADRPRSQPHQ
jgi:hypothetical protein